MESAINLCVFLRVFNNVLENLRSACNVTNHQNIRNSNLNIMALSRPDSRIIN